MKLEIVLLLLEIGLVLYLIFHQRAIWEELKVHREILEYALLDGADEPMEEPTANPLQGLLPQLLLQGLFTQPEAAPRVEEMEE